MDAPHGPMAKYSDGADKATTLQRHGPSELSDIAHILAHSHLYLDKFVNVVGIVTDLMPPVQTRGNDLKMTLTICDSTSSDGLRVNMFQTDKSDFPQVRDLGDIVVLRQLKVESPPRDTSHLISLC